MKPTKSLSPSAQAAPGTPAVLFGVPMTLAVASPELERALMFNDMVIDLQAAVVDRNSTVAAVRSAVAKYRPEFAFAARDLLLKAQQVEDGLVQPRMLESMIEIKAAHFAAAGSAAATLAPKVPDATAIYPTSIQHPDHPNNTRGRVR